MAQRIIVSFMLYVAVLFSTVQPASAQDSETGGKRQSPVQVLTTIAITAVMLQGLRYFKIP
jgi:hypothetical protein